MVDIVRESYTSGDNIGCNCPSKITSPPPTNIVINTKLAQTFTPQITHLCKRVRLKLGRSGSPGNFTVSILATDGNGKPTGNALCSGTSNGNTLTTSSSGAFRDVFLGDGTTVNVDIKYALVLEAPNATPGVNAVFWRVDNSNPTYTRGVFWVYPDIDWSEVPLTTSEDWESYSGRYEEYHGAGDILYLDTDALFIEYETPSELPSKPINPLPTNNDTEVDFTNFTLSWQNGGGATSYDVYIGPVGALIKVSSGQVGTTYITNISQVPYNQKIYWRIDAINASGTTTGDVWNFDARPAKVTLPVPDDGTDGVDLGLNELGWAKSELATEYDFYFREEGDDWDYIGETDELIFDIPIAFSKYFQVYEWRIDAKNQFGITTGDTWSFIIMHSRRFPYERRSDYSGIIGDDLVWDISSQAWTSDFDYLVAGGGRYRNQLVVVGHEVIYFGDI